MFKIRSSFFHCRSIAELDQPLKHTLWLWLGAVLRGILCPRPMSPSHVASLRPSAGTAHGSSVSVFPTASGFHRFRGRGSQKGSCVPRLGPRGWAPGLPRSTCSGPVHPSIIQSLSPVSAFRRVPLHVQLVAPKWDSEPFHHQFLTLRDAFSLAPDMSSLQPGSGGFVAFC